MNDYFSLKGKILNFLLHKPDKYLEEELITTLVETFNEHAGPIGREMSRLKQDGMIEANENTKELHLSSLGKLQIEEWLEENGGVAAMEKVNKDKAALLYDAIESSKMFYCPVEESDRSLMNVVFRVEGNNEDLEAKFATESSEQGLTTLKGHRSVGGLRASIYNAMPVDGVKALISFMEDFEKANK